MNSGIPESVRALGASTCKKCLVLAVRYKQQSTRQVLNFFSSFDALKAVKTCSVA